MPIGTLWDDVSKAALRVLRDCPHVFFEKEPGRVERLKEAGIVPRDRELLWLDEYALYRGVKALEAGESVALVAATGIPGFVDPGWELMDWWADEAWERVDLAPIGMSSALDAALAAVGTDVRSFRFGGHYPEFHTPVERPGRDPQVFYVRGQAVEQFVADCRAFGSSLKRVVLLGDVRKRGQSRCWVVGPGEGLPEGLQDDPKRDLVAVILGRGGRSRPAMVPPPQPKAEAPDEVPLRAWSPNELAKRIYAVGWKRWFVANRSWSVGRPETGPWRVAFPITGPDGGFTAVVQRAGGAAAVSGERLALAVEGDADERVVRELGALLLALDRKGFAFEKDGAEGRVELFISSACNLDCWFCMEHERIHEKSFMPWEALEARIRADAARGMRVVQFMGGEATIHPEFPRALRLCKELGLRTFVITNLLRWSDRGFAEEVAELLDEVMISIHAHGRQAGEHVTGSRTWWERFQKAHANFKATSRARHIRASTVFSRASEPHLEKIADLLLELGPERWVMGNGVPIEGARLSALDEGFTLTQLRDWRPRFEALSARCADGGCRLVFFCFPHCVLGPKLWDDSHDLVVDNQDLSEEAPGETESVNFWSKADFRSHTRAVTLGRTRPEVCRGCAREQVCGGHFSDYFARHGTDELEPVAG